jgi:pimeloyl-ACP methyl ester carboxylesterase
MTQSVATDVHHLARPEGRISYTVTGVGPLVVAVPGMGDLRSSYRELTAPLADAGFRVAVLDLRGHGDSDTTFREYGDTATASDILALIDELGGPAVVIGNSMAGSAAVVAAADRPDAVAGLVLISPFLREAQSAGARAVTRAMYRALFARPWGAAAWASYYAKTLNRGTQAPWLGEHVAEIRAALSDPAKLRSFRRLTTQLDHSVVEPRVASVTAPSLVIVGSVDPDYTDPTAELTAMGTSLGAETLLVDGVAHYPHAARPDIVTPRILGFIEALRQGNGWRRTGA